jgi:flagellar basal-body rod protein FlgB
MIYKRICDYFISPFRSVWHRFPKEIECNRKIREVKSVINTNIYNYINILDRAADAANMRNEILSNNIANVDTPGYKRKDVSFETILKMSMYGTDSLDKRVSDINDHISDYNGLIYTDHSRLAYRLDGNNVDIDTESARLAENQIRYNTLEEQMGQEFARYKSVISGS